MLTLKGDFTFKGKCPRHPRYDPLKHGRGAIKGGCKKCYALYALYEAWVLFLAARRNADEAVNNT